MHATHVVTGISVKIQTERSLHANKLLARKLLTYKLAELKDAQAQERWLSHRQLERGNPVRVFKGDKFREA